MRNKENEMKAWAVMNLVNSMISSYAKGGTSDTTISLADLYKTAESHISDRYNVTFESIEEAWGTELANDLKD